MQSKHKRLRHIPTGRVFAWNEVMAKRADMETFDSSPVQKKKQPKPEPKEESWIEPVAESHEPEAEPDAAIMAAAVLGKKRTKE